jgi:hypothetical protein
MKIYIAEIKKVGRKNVLLRPVDGCRKTLGGKKVGYFLELSEALAFQWKCKVRFPKKNFVLVVL